MKTIPSMSETGNQTAADPAGDGRYTSSRIVRRDRGFALVVTVSLLVLLSVIALGFLSLSAVTLRSGSQEQVQATARAHARLALMLALGELQKHAGPDTRITAPASIVDPASPPLVGVWKSWEGSDHDSTGRPLAPDYESKKSADGDGGGRFLGWLVSGAVAGQAPTDPASLASSEPVTGSVPLLAAGTLGENAPGQIHLLPVGVTTENGAGPAGTHAWWVSGENQKMRLPEPYSPKDNSAAAWSDLVKSHAVPDPEELGLNDSHADYLASAHKTISRRSLELLPGQDPAAKPQQLFHDLSTTSVGLLTNSATGGWRKDMSLMTENWGNLPGSDLPLFRLSPDTGDTTAFTKPTTASVAAVKALGSLFYPWAAYPAPNIARESHGPVVTWPSIVDYATAYKRITPTGNNNSFDAVPRPWASTAASAVVPIHDYLHKLRITPLIARIHWKFAHRTVRDNKGTPETDDDTFTPQILMTPVITLWNPYNVRITCSRSLNIRLAKPLPVAFRHYLIDPDTGARTALDYKKLFVGIPNDWPSTGYSPDVPYPAYAGTGHINHTFPNSTFTLEPGETRVFSATNTATMPPRGDTSNRTLTMDVGYRPNNGLVFTNLDSALRLKENDPVLVDATFDATSYSLGLSLRTAPYDPVREAVRLYIHVFADGGENYNVNLMMENSMAYRAETARAYWPSIPHAELPQPTAGELSLGWQPFLSTVFGSRVASDSHMPGKGVVQTSPMLAVDNMTQWTNNSGRDHPVNAPYDFSFLPHTGGGDNNLPNIEPGTNRGYIVSGFDASEGLTRVIMSELPLRPLASLAELNNYDLRGQNRQPPFQLNIIGNSDASPLLPSNRVYISNALDSLQYDDPYCANHLLFDDWFFSSIAPDPDGFGKSISSDLQTVYRDFLKGERRLTNHNYRPISEDQGLDDGLIAGRVTDALSSDGWQRIASRFEVEGMFNVNSTSVKAWCALLGHARDQKNPYFEESGITLSEKADHVFSRFSVAGDGKAGDPGMSGKFPEATEFTGYRVFTDDLLDSLAEKVVEQVKLRGPFLSMSEFINRRLGAATDERVLAGAIQIALNKMGTEAGNASPFKTLQDLSTATQADPPGDEDYRFRAAAVGHSAYGLPGWIRQADVLRPLAPILSVRDDAFTIRAYGDARDASGTVIARAWCEATVRRTRDFIDPADAPDSTDTTQQPVNQTYGRRFVITSFRWLMPEEV